MGTCSSTKKHNQNTYIDYNNPNHGINKENGLNNEHKRMNSFSKANDIYINEKKKENDLNYQDNSKVNQKKYNQNKPNLNSNNLNNKKINKDDNSDMKQNKDYISDALKSHNEYRKKHKSGDLEINPELCKIAQEYSDTLAKTKNFKQSGNKFNGKPLGENIFMCFANKKCENIGKIASESWYNEKNNYDFKKPGFRIGIGNFTQMIWKNTKFVGFGFRYNDEGIYYVVANYFPAGNIDSPEFFKDNVLPSDSYIHESITDKSDSIIDNLNYSDMNNLNDKMNNSNEKENNNNENNTNNDNENKGNNKGNNNENNKGNNDENNNGNNNGNDNGNNDNN